MRWSKERHPRKSQNGCQATNGQAPFTDWLLVAAVQAWTGLLHKGLIKKSCSSNKPDGHVVLQARQYGGRLLLIVSMVLSLESCTCR